MESLRWEVEPLGIKTLLIDLGRHRTKFLSDENVKFVPTKIEDYKAASRDFRAGIAKEDRAQPADPEKSCKIILDLVRNEGIAIGKEIPFRLPLGVDSFDTIKEESEDALKLLEDWGFVIKSTEFEE